MSFTGCGGDLHLQLLQWDWVCVAVVLGDACGPQRTRTVQALPLAQVQRAVLEYEPSEKVEL